MFGLFRTLYNTHMHTRACVIQTFKTQSYETTIKQFQTSEHQSRRRKHMEREWFDSRSGTVQSWARGRSPCRSDPSGRRRRNHSIPSWGRGWCVLWLRAWRCLQHSTNSINIRGATESAGSVFPGQFHNLKEWTSGSLLFNLVIKTWNHVHNQNTKDITEHTIPVHAKCVLSVMNQQNDARKMVYGQSSLTAGFVRSATENLKALHHEGLLYIILTSTVTGGTVPTIILSNWSV